VSEKEHTTYTHRNIIIDHQFHSDLVSERERRKKSKWFRVISYKLVMSSEINVIVQFLFTAARRTLGFTSSTTKSAFGGSEE
jgi:hypothetical protein